MYLVVTSVWIAFSDRVVAALVSDEDALTRVQTLKGWAFVVATSLGLFFLIRRVIRVIEQRASQQRRSDELLREIFVNSPLGIIITDRAGNHRQVNKAFAELLGYSPEELTSMNHREVTYSDDLDLTEGIYESLGSSDGRRVMMEVRYVRSDGSPIWVHLTASSVYLAEDAYAVGIVKGISERKEAEAERNRTLNELRIGNEERQALLERLMIAEEEERRRIAGDIHDDSLQVMTAALMQIDLAGRPGVSQAERQRLLATARDQLEDSMRRLRDLVFDLRPPLLEQQGLEPALANFIKGAAGRSGVSWTIQDGIVGDLPLEVAAAAYRVAREAVSNALRHAEASTLDVALVTEGGRLTVRVVDNGRGLRESEGSSRQHFGLELMQERVSQLGGSLAIHGDETEPGTRIEFWLPLEPGAEEAQLSLDASWEREAG